LKYLFLFLTLASAALANSPPVPTVGNDALGVEARVGRIDDMKGLIITQVTNGSPGDTTGLAPGDLLIGYRGSDVLVPEANPFVMVTPENFNQFPPNFGHMNLRHQVLVYRPSLDRTSIITLNFGGARQYWPAGALGITVTERPNEPVALRNRNVETKPDLVVVSTYPYMLAYRLGIRAGDIIYGAKITQENGNYLGFSISGADDLDKFLKAARQAPDTETAVIEVMRPVPDVAPPDAGDLEFTIPVTRLK
jgi:hypothetical protein